MPRGLGPFCAPSFPCHLPNSAVTATQGPVGGWLSGAPKAAISIQKGACFTMSSLSQESGRTRQAGEVHYPLLSEEMLRTARQVTCRVSKLPSWDLNWVCLPPDPVPSPLLCIYAQGLGSRNDPQTNRVIPAALNFALNSGRHPEWPHLIRSL